MPVVVRTVLWLLMVLAPGGVFLLPLLIADARRRQRTVPDGGSVDTPATPAVHGAAPVSAR